MHLNLAGISILNEDSPSRNNDATKNENVDRVGQVKLVRVVILCVEVLIRELTLYLVY